MHGDNVNLGACVHTILFLRHRQRHAHITPLQHLTQGVLELASNVDTFLRKQGSCTRRLCSHVQHKRQRDSSQHDHCHLLPETATQELHWLLATAARPGRRVATVFSIQ